MGLSGEKNSSFKCDFMIISVLSISGRWNTEHKAPNNRVLAWNSRWRSPIGLTQSDLMTSLSHGTADWFSPVSVANELTAQYYNTWLLFAVAVCSALQKTSTFPSSTCIDLLRGDHVYYMGVIYMCYMCRSSISYMLTVACCGCIGSSKSRYLLCRSNSVADLFRQDQIH